MSEIPESFRIKSPDELQKQIEDVEHQLGEKVAPGSIDIENQETQSSLDLSEDSIRSRFKRRYDIYLRALRAIRREDYDEDYSGSEEAEKARNTLRMLNNLDRYIENHHRNKEGRTLRDRQITVFSVMRDFLEAGGEYGTVKLPTGVGKTVLFTEFLEALDVKTLIVVPKENLVTQTIEKVNKFATNLSVGAVYGKSKQFGRQVTVITYQSLPRQLRSGAIKQDEYPLVIFDEEHRSHGPSTAVDVASFSKSIRFGFTATPKNKEQIIYSMSLREAIDEGLLCQVIPAVVRTEIDISGVKVEGGDFDKDELEKLLNVEGRNTAAVNTYRENFQGASAMAFCVNIKHAKSVSDLFNKEGIASAMVSGNTPKEEFEEILKKFRSGEIKVLCSADKLIEGFDESAPSVCLNLRPTLSRFIAEQRAGRVARLDPSNPYKIAYVIDFLDMPSKESKGSRRGTAPYLFFEILQEKSFGSLAQEKEGSTNNEITDDDSSEDFNFGNSRFGESVPSDSKDIKVTGLKVSMQFEELKDLAGAFGRLREGLLVTPPSGWIRRMGIEEGARSRLINMKYRASTTLASLQEEYPDKFKRCKQNGYIAWYCDPSIEIELNARLSEMEKEEESQDFKTTSETERRGSPESLAGFLSFPVIARKARVAYGTVKNVWLREKNDHPEWFAEVSYSKGENGSKKKLMGSSEFYKFIHDEYSQWEDAPKGWMSRQRLVDEMPGLSFKKMIILTEEIKEKMPDAIRQYRHPVQGDVFWFYSPEAQRYIFERIGTPRGWRPDEEVAQSCGIPLDTLRNIIEEHLREDTPRDFLMRDDVQYISPKMAKVFRDVFTEYAE